MINKMIKTYLNKYENREYISALFGKLFEDAIDLKDYLRNFKTWKLKESVGVLPVNDIPLLAERSVDANIELSCSPLSPTTRFIEDHFTGPFSLEPIKLQPLQKIVSEEVKIIAEDVNSDKLPTEDIFLICDHILEVIDKKLLYMPLSIRYLCVLVAKIAQQFVCLLYYLVEPQTTERSPGRDGPPLPKMVASCSDET